MAASTLPPGPSAPRLAQAVLWGLRYPQFTQRAHRRFGSTFTVRPGTMDPAVVTTDREAIAKLLTGDPLRKAHGNDVVRPLIDDGAVILLNGEEHLARRKLLLPPFHGERVRRYAQLMQTLMDAETGRWAPGHTVAVLPVAQNVTIEVILQAVLGVADPELRAQFRRLIDNVLFYPMGELRLRLGRALQRGRPAPRRVREVAAFLGAVGTPAVMTYFPETKQRAAWNVGTLRWWHHHDRLMKLVDDHIAATRSDPRLGEREDILAMLVPTVSDEDLREEVLTLISAGHETTAAAIAWGAVLLAHNPGVQERAREGDDRYLGALVKEVLRIRPPLPVAATRILDEDIQAGGHTVPAGTLLLIDSWGLHHDPARHPEPGRFRPERFLEDDTESYSWLPFGGGARRCIGAALAELEIRVALSTMVRRFRLEPLEAEVPPLARRGIVMVPAGGGRITITARPEEAA